MTVQGIDMCTRARRVIDPTRPHPTRVPLPSIRCCRGPERASRLLDSVFVIYFTSSLSTWVSCLRSLPASCTAYFVLEPSPTHSKSAPRRTRIVALASTSAPVAVLRRLTSRGLITELALAPSLPAYSQSSWAKTAKCPDGGARPGGSCSYRRVPI